MNPGNSWRTASARGMVVPYFMHNWRADSRGLPRTTCADTLQMVSGVTQPAGTCSSATCVSSGAIAGRGQRHRSLDHSSGRTLFTGSRSPARVGVPRRIGPGRRRRSPAPSVNTSERFGYRCWMAPPRRSRTHRALPPATAWQCQHAQFAGAQVDRGVRSHRRVAACTVARASTSRHRSAGFRQVGAGRPTLARWGRRDSP